MKTQCQSCGCDVERYHPKRAATCQDCKAKSRKKYAKAYYRKNKKLLREHVSKKNRYPRDFFEEGKRRAAAVDPLKTSPREPRVFYKKPNTLIIEVLKELNIKV